MANPKHKISKSRRDKRRSQIKLVPSMLVLCPQCHEPKQQHHVCLRCGTYKGREIIHVEEI